MLRPPQPEDFDRYAELRGDASSCRFIGGAVGRNEAWRWFLHLAGSWFLQGAGPFCVLEKASGRFLGYVGPWFPEGWPCREIIYAFHPDSQGRGLAREAAAHVIDWVFEQLDWDAVHHFISPDNTPSQRLAAHLGATVQGSGRLPPPWQAINFEIWRQSRTLWQHSRQRLGLGGFGRSGAAKP